METIREVAHRSERVSAITSLAPEETLTPEALGALVTSSRGGLTNAPRSARVAALINKVESPSRLAVARRVARCILREPRVERVALGALQGASSDWEIWSR